MTTAIVLMTKNEARKAIVAIRDAFQAGLDAFEHGKALAAVFEEREGFRVLGFRSMSACMAEQLGVTQRRAQQILVEIRETALLTEALGEPVHLTSRDAAALASHPENHETVSRFVAAGHEPSEALQRALAEQRAAPMPKPKSHSRAVHGLDGLLATLRRLAEQLETIADERTEDDALPSDLVRLLQRNADVMQRLVA